jgi:O-methyltransferase
MTKIKLLSRALRGDSYLRFAIARRIVQRLDPGNFLGETHKIWLREAGQVFAKLDLPTYHFQIRADRLWTLHECISSVDELEGDLIEFGVHAGTSAAVMLNACGRGKFWGVDSFQGLSEPMSEVDGLWWKQGDLATSYSSALQQLTPWRDRVEMVVGWIPECLENLPDNLAFKFAHVDVDLYEPTRASLEFVGSRMVLNGVIVCDDYGFETCPGAKRAIDEFLASTRHFRKVHLPTGQAVLHRICR